MKKTELLRAKRDYMELKVTTRLFLSFEEYLMMKAEDDTRKYENL